MNTLSYFNIEKSLDSIKIKGMEEKGEEVLFMDKTLSQHHVHHMIFVPSEIMDNYKVCSTQANSSELHPDKD